MLKNSQYDAVVVGAGIIGASLALGLASKKNWKVALIEKTGSLKNEEQKVLPNERVTALGLAAKDLLSDLGVWNSLNLDQANPFQRMFVWDEGSDGELEFNAHEHAAEHLGYMVDPFVLQAQLQEKIEQDFSSNIDVFYGSEIQSMNSSDAQNIDLELLAENSVVNIKANWLFAADGVNSTVREMAGIDTRNHAYQQRGIVAVIQTEKSHQNTAWQRFLSTGPLALLPLHNGQCSIVWTLSNNSCEEMLVLSEADFCSRLESALQSRLGKIELCSARKSFPLHSKQAESYLKEGVVLLGDAAHGIHPLAGQGANLGFGDVNQLLNVLEDLPSDDQKMQRALRQFERAQKLENYSMDLLMTGLESVFKSDNVMVSSLRRIGLKTINKHFLPKSFLASRVLNR